uniref:Uncharacterized protein n=1 Tax=Meloidogyne enterolobii TaxID=390850 RepID=A0A6V7WWC9_MELEN|nr:unnamed protein product [Meloidogyne enterolobii]
MKCDPVERKKIGLSEPLINGLCILYLYGEITPRNLISYMGMNYHNLMTKLHGRKIRLFPPETCEDSLSRKHVKYNPKIISKIKLKLKEKSKEKCGGKSGLRFLRIFPHFVVF